jgi:hypothetical protein|tara:strand:+ start:2578 stop:2835 length:258 start_codon:yes stop_codon:yes gene_type:complete
MFEYILYYLLISALIMTYFIQVNQEIIYETYLRFEKKRGNTPSNGWFNFYIFVQYVKSPIYSPLILINILLGGAGKVYEEDRDEA